MAETFYTILTAIGKAKLANSQVTGNKVNLTQMAVGNSNGNYYNPTESQTSLVNETWRGNIGSINIDPENENWIVIETVIPPDIGGFNVREVGLIDTAGDLIAIGKYPDTYKPILAEGSAKDLYIRMIIEVTNAASITLKIDPAITIASRKYVDDALTVTADPSEAPGGNGPGKLTKWVGWFANRIKAITGKANWWENPSKNLEDLDRHLADIVTEPVANKILKLNSNAQYPRSVDSSKRQSTFLKGASTTTHSVTIDLTSPTPIEESLLAIKIELTNDPAKNMRYLVRKSVYYAYLMSILNTLQNGTSITNPTLTFSDSIATFTCTSSITTDLRITIYETVI